ncbi:winged helix-turn-helix domain-containing protein [Hamadaea sp. NPDC051192]|uniref:winged helix-turn-helix domain-containing protein n=1 Tax=Hamadaea sp. NPDC051192 TaxID=3154940 RepID=UPI0034359A06
MLTSLVEHDWLDGVWLAKLTGDFTDTGHVDLRRIIRKCLADDPAAIVVDLVDVTSDGEVLATALATEQRRAAKQGIALAFVLRAKIAEELKSTIMGRHLAVFPTVEAARFLAVHLVPHRWLHLTLESQPQSVAYARNQAGAACLDWGVPWLQGAARLIASELVDNAIRHGGGVAELTVSLQRELLRIRVHDRSEHLPSLRVPASPWGDWQDSTSGLQRVDAYATAWGVRKVDDGKVVWATVRVHDTASAKSRLEGQPSAPSRPSGHAVAVGDMVLDPVTRLVSLDNRAIQLSSHEFELLDYLMRRAGQIVTKRQLLTDVWRLPDDAASGVVDDGIHSLREKLGEEGSALPYLHTVPGLGVRLTPPADE